MSDVRNDTNSDACSDVRSDEEHRVRLERLRWRSRRGLLEMDLVLERFMPQYLERLNEEELQAYAALLQESDTDLLDYVNGRAEPEDELQRRIVGWWRTV